MCRSSLQIKESIEETTTGIVEVEPQAVAVLEQKLQQAVKELEKNKELLDLANKEIDEKNKKLNELLKELSKLKFRCENEPSFDIEKDKHCVEDIAFYTGLPNCDSLLLCYEMLKDKAENLSYGGHQPVNFEGRKSGPKRKLTTWQSFILVLLRLRLGLLERDLAERFKVSVSTVSDIIKTGIVFMKMELQELCIRWPRKEHLLLHAPSLQTAVSRSGQHNRLYRDLYGNTIKP